MTKRNDELSTTDIAVVTKVLHEEHSFSDHRSLAGYNHCECVERARRIVGALKEHHDKAQD